MAVLERNAPASGHAKGNAEHATNKASTSPNKAVSHRVTAPDLAAESTSSSLKSSAPLHGLDCVLFLDVDGVLHTPNPKHERLLFRSTCMDLLRSICAQTNCHIVLSTTWRLHEQSRAALAAKLAEHGCPEFVSKTPSIAQFQRPKEILAWVNKYRPVAWCAVDDWPLHEDPRMKGHFVQTRARYGLQPDTAARVVELLATQHAEAAR